MGNNSIFLSSKFISPVAWISLHNLSLVGWFMRELCQRSSTTQFQMDPVYNHVFVMDLLHWLCSHFRNFGFFDNFGMDCASNRVDCNVGLCGRFSAIFRRRQRHLLRWKCMRLSWNAKDLVSQTSELKTLLCVVFFLLPNSATKMYSYGILLPCLIKTSAAGGAEKFSAHMSWNVLLMKLRIMMKPITYYSSSIHLPT